MGRDWSGYKYTIFKSLGISVDMISGYQSDGAKEMKFHLISHEHNDGIGAMRRLCQYYQFQLPEPAIRHARPEPGLLVKVKRFKQHLNNAPNISYNWKDYDSTIEGLSPGFTYALFSEEASDILHTYCRQHRIGETALLLYALDKAATVKLLNDCEKRTWLLPHDFRRAIGKQLNNSNITSPLNLHLQGVHQPETIYQQIKTLYRQDILWGGWVYTNFTAYLPKWFIVQAFRCMQKPAWFGVFANMGRWNSENDEPIKGHWVSAPPAAIIAPVTAGAMTWNNQTSLSLQCHPSLKLDENDIENLMADWINILSEIMSIELTVEVQSIAMESLIKIADRL